MLFIGDGQLASTQQASPPSAAGQSSLEIGDLSPGAQRLSCRSAEDGGGPEQEAATPQKVSQRTRLDQLGLDESL